GWGGGEKGGGISGRPKGCRQEQAALYRPSAIRGFRGPADRTSRRNRCRLGFRRAWKSLLAMASVKLLLRPAKLLCGGGIRSIFSRCAEIIGETGADIGYEEIVDAHPALRELLLINVGQESIQRRKAAFD